MSIFIFSPILMSICLLEWRICGSSTKRSIYSFRGGCKLASNFWQFSRCVRVLHKQKSETVPKLLHFRTGYCGFPCWAFWHPVCRFIKHWFTPKPLRVFVHRLNSHGFMYSLNSLPCRREHRQVLGKRYYCSIIYCT